jgi:hypothetical protein
MTTSAPASPHDLQHTCSAVAAGRGLKILVIDRHMAKQAITGFKDALPILLMTLSGVWMSVS